MPHRPSIESYDVVNIMISEPYSIVFTFDLEKPLVKSDIIPRIDIMRSDLLKEPLIQTFLHTWLTRPAYDEEAKELMTLLFLDARQTIVFKDVI
jgi:hypothetical protein